MGITGLLPLLKPVVKDGHVSQFKGKTVAVDGYVWLHRAVYGCCVQLANNDKSADAMWINVPPTSLVSPSYVKDSSRVDASQVAPIYALHTLTLPAWHSTPRTLAS
jgi:hypothetical protein